MVSDSFPVLRPRCTFSCVQLDQRRSQARDCWVCAAWMRRGYFNSTDSTGHQHGTGDKEIKKRALETPASGTEILSTASSYRISPTGVKSFCDPALRLCRMNRVNENCGPDAYAERLRAAFVEISQPDYREGMISWLDRTVPQLYVELTDRLPNEIDRIWSAHGLLTEFEEVIERFTRTHRQAHELYLKHFESIGGYDGPSSYRKG